MRRCRGGVGKRDGDNRNDSQEELDLIPETRDTNLAERLLQDHRNFKEG